MSNTQSVKAVAKYIRMSPHKVRRVLNQIRGRSYQEALMILEFLPYGAGGPVWQVVHSAAANAQNNYDLDKKKLMTNGRKLDFDDLDDELLKLSSSLFSLEQEAINMTMEEVKVGYAKKIYYQWDF